MKEDFLGEKGFNLGDDLCNVIIYPPYEDMVNRRKELREELLRLVLEKDELVLIVCKNIEAEYLVRFGYLEYKAHNAENCYLRMKRKRELVRAYINRQESVNEEKIELQLEIEFEEYKERLERYIRNIDKAVKHKDGEVLSDKDTKKIKKLYHKIVKAIHPDLNHNVTEAELVLLKNAIVAYKRGDIINLEIIAGSIINNVDAGEQESTLGEIKADCKHIEGLIAATKSEIERIKEDYPYNVKEYVEDEGKEKERISLLKNIIKEYEDAAELIEREIFEMTR